MPKSLLLSFTLGLYLALVGQSATAQQTERYAGIDVGSRGVKFVMIEVENRGGVRVPQILSGKDNEAEVKNSGLNDSAGLTQKYSKEAMEATVTAIKAFVEKARNQGVPDDHIFIVGSSGLQPARNREEFRGLVMAATKAPGHQECGISYISYEDEVAFTFLDVAPPAWRQKSWALDIGSGNTKFGYAALSAESKWVPRAGQLRYATGTFRDSAIKGFALATPDDPAAAAAEFSEHCKSVRAALKIDGILGTELQKLEVQNRPRLYLSGGIVWALVTILKPEQIAQEEVKITKADVEQFRQRVRQPVDKIFAGVNLAGLAPAQREAADKDLKSVQKIFASYAETDPKNPEKKLPSPIPQADLIAGAEILDAVAETVDFDHLEVLFPRKAVNAWIRSYVLFNADYQLVENPFPENPPAEKTQSSSAISPPVPAPVTPPMPQDRVPGSARQDAPNTDALQAKIEQLTAQVNDLKSQLKQRASQSSVDAISKQVANLEDKQSLGAIEKKLDAILAEQQRLKAMAGTLQNSVNQLRGAVENVRSQTQPGSSRGAASTIAPPQAALPRDAAERVFYEGLGDYQNGQYSEAYDCFCRASVGQENPQYWYGRAVAAWQLKLESDFETSAQRAGQLLAGGKSSDYKTVDRVFYRVQGPARLAIDSIVRTTIR
ncbi:MAG TPA: hypothetical protein VGJ15_12630 [Pirellulales bacterium]|jgi:hypothetical protein